MQRGGRVAAVALTLALGGCTVFLDFDRPAAGDGGGQDAGAFDAGARDGAVGDDATMPLDGGADAGRIDAGRTDAGGTDAGVDGGPDDCALMCGSSGDRCNTSGSCECGETGAACTAGTVCRRGSCGCPSDHSATNVHIAGTTTPDTLYAGTPIRVLPGEELTFSGTFSVNHACGTCVVVVVFGIATPGYGHEAFACVPATAGGSVPGACTGAGGTTGPHPFRAPDTHGVYQIRMVPGAFFTTMCTEAQDWFESFRTYEYPVVAEIEVAAGTAGRCHVVETSAVQLNGMGNEITVAPGTRVDVQVDWTYVTGMATGAITQVLHGFVGPDASVDATLCGYDRTLPGVCISDPGSSMGSWTAPTTPGRYDLRWRLWQDFNCTGARAGFVSAPPGRESTVGVVHVVP
ncbi:MAG: hypothetical protein R3B82_09985 [Sandaracinaceae bacterium]